MSGKLIIISAPSGAGKTSIVKKVLHEIPSLAFSISATNRPKRENEKEGRDYYFLSSELFMQKIEENAFLEWQEVYAGRFYGTLKSEVERIWAEGKDVIFDIDVLGGLNLKRQFEERALSIFIKPPSTEELMQRLSSRGTESVESLKERYTKAEFELSFENQFDVAVINDDLQHAQQEVIYLVKNFIAKK